MWTEAQLDALRRLDPEDEYAPSNGVRIHHKTLAHLIRYGYAEKAENAAGAVLTERGLSTIRRYVEQTGNGPERLKAMLRF